MAQLWRSCPILEDRILAEINRQNLAGAADAQVRNTLLELCKQIESYGRIIADAGRL
jgi:hypothetical protein